MLDSQQATLLVILQDVVLDHSAQDGACDQPQATGVSVGHAVNLKEATPPRRWFLITRVPKWLPTKTMPAESLPPRISMRLRSNVLADESAGDRDGVGPAGYRLVHEVSHGVDHLGYRPVLSRRRS